MTNLNKLQKSKFSNGVKKIVLAYSGGLDTSVAIRWLIDRGFSVICYMGDVGQGGEVKRAKARALKIGAAKVIVDDLKKEFAADFIMPALKANAVYESDYFLATALSRPILAKGLVKTAKAEKAGYVAHGCTGKGNDQVRFEVAINSLNPKLKVIAPLREWEFSSREAEMRFAKMKGIPVETTKKSPYSLDINLWGASIEAGPLEKPWNEPPKNAYFLTKDPLKAPKKAKYITIYFEKGIPKKLDGKSTDLVTLISALNKTGGAYGVGRTDMVENRLVGIKSREIYEAPAAKILVTAHKALEGLVLDRELAHFKEAISLKYAELAYYGLWFTPLKKALDKFINETQNKVTGTVKLKLFGGNCITVGRKSKFSMYNEEMATYSEKDKFDHKLAKGFIELWGMPYKKA